MQRPSPRPPPTSLAVACVNANVVDGYGDQLQRKGSCYDTSATVTVMITDTCPCDYPSNAYSNKRERRARGRAGSTAGKEPHAAWQLIRAAARPIRARMGRRPKH